jgi:hypothetical protein
MLGHRFGAFRRPAALGLPLRIARPFGVSVPPKTSLQSAAKNALQTFLRSLPESRPSALGSRAHSPASLNVTRATTGEFKKRRHSHVSEQSNAHRFSWQQRRSSQQRQLHNAVPSSDSIPASPCPPAFLPIGTSVPPRALAPLHFRLLLAAGFGWLSRTKGGHSRAGFRLFSGSPVENARARGRETGGGEGGILLPTSSASADEHYTSAIITCVCKGYKRIRS